jgi:hypothetical protein
MTQAAARDRFLGVLAALAIVLTVVACSSPARPRAAGSAGSARAAAPAAPGAISGSPSSPVTMAGAKHCPVTLPRRVGPSGPARQQFFGWGSSFGNGKLWVGGLWPHGVIAASAGFVDRRGRVGMKFGWWRKVPGRLHITGRRLDAPAPPLRADVPAGYGAAGFQPSGVTFPTEGCWEVTGTVHRASLTFVTFVIKKGRTSG